MIPGITSDEAVLTTRAASFFQVRQIIGQIEGNIVFLAVEN